MDTHFSLSPRNANHPRKGATIKVEPIRRIEDIERVKAHLENTPRDRCLFIFGINTAYRAKELLSIRVGQVRHLKAGDGLDLKQSKNKRYRMTTLNRPAIVAIKNWLDVHPYPVKDAPLFPSRKGGALGVAPVNHMMKRWCAAVGLEGNYGSHTLRKTWGYHQLRRNKKTAPHLVLPLLMEAYGHATQQQTLEYLCIQSDEIATLFMDMEL